MVGFGLASCGGSNSIGATLATANSSVTSTSLKAGGAPEIVFPSAVEGFGGTVHENPHVTVMVFEANNTVAIVSGVRTKSLLLQQRRLKTAAKHRDQEPFDTRLFFCTLSL
ncbi:hypothetical protein [Paraburkholderia metrosideri]|uniref:Uncharacterized protein n=1 Tax=Paraburkholderia metrosideri TaxID=580937 RepID=A0ABM8P917_9BURK|nr:hypothetical protein [Paraburkholderia metrosideri]CAD6559548.1 hypothetical protein LMG28140_06655 [Paraburkholderia metrosideri]